MRITTIFVTIAFMTWISCHEESLKLEATLSEIKIISYKDFVSGDSCYYEQISIIINNESSDAARLQIREDVASSRSLFFIVAKGDTIFLNFDGPEEIVIQSRADTVLNFVPTDGYLYSCHQGYAFYKERLLFISENSSELVFLGKNRLQLNIEL